MPNLLIQYDCNSISYPPVQVFETCMVLTLSSFLFWCFVWVLLLVCFLFISTQLSPLLNNEHVCTWGNKHGPCHTAAPLGSYTACFYSASHPLPLPFFLVLCFASEAKYRRSRRLRQKYSNFLALLQVPKVRSEASSANHTINVTSVPGQIEPCW